MSAPSGVANSLGPLSHGLSLGAPSEISRPTGGAFLNWLELPIDARERVTVTLRMIDILDAQIHELERSLRKIARHPAGCQALMTQFGVGELIALVTLTELGDVRPMSSSRTAVRFAGIERVLPTLPRPRTPPALASIEQGS